MIDDRAQYLNDQSRATIWFEKAGRYITAKEVVDLIMLKLAERRPSC